MGNGTSRVVGCFVPNGKGGVDLEFSEPLDEGLGHSFCYVRPSAFDSPAMTPSNSERFTVDSSTLDSETLSGSFRHDNIEDPSNLNRLNKNFTETTFKTISGASVSANVSTARTGNQNVFASDMLEPAASFEGTASFAALPLQPVPHGNGFMSGPLGRGFASGPLDRGGGFMSGPIERGVMSGPLDATDQSNFSAPLARGRHRKGLHRLMKSVSGPMKSTITRTFSKHSLGSHWMQRFFLHPMTRLAWHSKEPKYRSDVSRNLDGGPSEGDYINSHNLQWAHGKAGEDRVHVVLSEEQGWLFVGIYDGFSGPDAPDFLMSHLYRELDKELEGLLWDYELKASDEQQKSEPPNENSQVNLGRNSNEQPTCDGDQAISGCLNESCSSETVAAQLTNCEIVKDNIDNRVSIDMCPSKCEKPITMENASHSVPNESIGGQGRKSMRLYELLQMESWEGRSSASLSEVGSRRTGSWDSQQSADVHISRVAFQKEQLRSNSLSTNGDCSMHQSEIPSTSGENGEIGSNQTNKDVVAGVSVPLQWHGMRKSIIGSKIRKMYRKQKSLRKKLFPWSYDWHREENCIDERMIELSGPMRRCISGTVDHGAILRAMARALQNTEEAYMELVEKSLDKNAELALMGSCVLVMLMKDQDVYVMNLGDSRVILAQERPSDRLLNPSFTNDDLRYRNRSRESLVRMELDRISEESPMHNHSAQTNKINKNREISLCRLRMRALQLSTDHSTSIEEEVRRIKSEHPDDNQAIMNDRVKGQLKVTRAFGAGFLKMPTFNEALLEIFRIDYVGTAPYVSCIPSVVHHRLSSSDRFLILSSDGLYQYFSNEEVIAHVMWFMENVPDGDPAQYLIAELLFRAAKKNGMDFHELLDIPQGDRRKYHDDVSVMVVSLEGRIWRSSG